MASNERLAVAASDSESANSTASALCAASSESLGKVVEAAEREKCGATAKTSSPCLNCPARQQQGKIAASNPYRIHVLVPKGGADVSAGAGASEVGTSAEGLCDCGRQHMIFGQRYRYCTCGLADPKTSQPFCDGVSCKGSSFEGGLEFVCDKKQTYYLLCGCKRTETPPHCDGAHIHIDWAKEF